MERVSRRLVGLMTTRTRFFASCIALATECTEFGLIKEMGKDVYWLGIGLSLIERYL